MKVLVGFVLFVTACASTSVLSTWKDPSIGQLAFHKVLVYAPSRDPSLRRIAEDQMVSEIRTSQAVASYTVIPESELSNPEAIRARARAMGFDGAVILRITSVDKEATWVP